MNHSNESKRSEMLTISHDIEIKSTLGQLIKMANELDAVKTENKLLITSYNQLDNYQVNLKKQNNMLIAAYNQLSNYQVSLKKQNTVLIDELCLAKIDIDSATRGKRTFLNIISHELMTPLTAIIGFAEILSLTGLPQKQQNQVGHIVDASRQLHEMFTELLTYIQLNSGQVTVENKTFLPATLLTEVSNRINNQALAKGLSVTMHVDPALPVLLGDEPLLKHALDILAVNALKFTQQGSISLTAQLLDKKEDRLQIAFIVKDSGIGIPLERQKELFNAFSPLDSSLSRPYRGIGLGLAICSQLVTLLGGEIDVESSLDNGSQFRIKIWLERQFIE